MKPALNCPDCGLQGHPRTAHDMLPTASKDLGDLLDRVRRAGRGDRVLLDEVTAALGPAGPNAVLLFVALIALSPATVVPGVASVVSRGVWKFPSGASGQGWYVAA